LPLKDHQYSDFQAHVAASDSNVMQSSLSGTDVRLKMFVLCSLSQSKLFQRPFASLAALWVLYVVLHFSGDGNRLTVFVVPLGL
jgi:hypothetical protein